MNAPVQSCGTCRWLDAGSCGPIAGNFYPCKAPVPESWSPFFREGLRMSPSYGTTCPCYAPREGGEETR